MHTFISYITIGSFAGLVSGLLGVGGGVVVVPALLWVLKHQLPSANIFHLAAGTSLAIMVITSSASTIAHIGQGHLKWPLVAKLLPGLLLGVIIGVALASFLPSNSLKVLFAIVVFIIAVKLLLGIQLKHHHIPSHQVLWLLTLAMGLISGALGIGIGSLGIPFLISCGITIRKASATVLIATLPVALCGTVSAIVAGWQVTKSPYSMGYVYWPAFLGVSITSALVAPMAALLADQLPTQLLKRMLAVFLLIVSLSFLMYWR